LGSVNGAARFHASGTSHRAAARLAAGA
jgi:hypothetical protein